MEIGDNMSDILEPRRFIWKVLPMIQVLNKLNIIDNLALDNMYGTIFETVDIPSVKRGVCSNRTVQSCFLDIVWLLTECDVPDYTDYAKLDLLIEKIQRRWKQSHWKHYNKLKRKYKRK